MRPSTSDIAVAQLREADLGMMVVSMHQRMISEY